MDLDLETFLTTLYVMVDDLYQTHVRPQMPACGGPPPDLSDSEVLCLGLAAQWRSGVPWKSERGFLRYAHKHLRPLFPGLTSQSAFNRRLRRLWGAFLLLQDAVAQELVPPTDFEIFDGVPVPVARGARSFHPGWFPDLARIGKGGNDRYFYGLHLLLLVSASGLALAWTLGAGNVQERWPAELLLSARAGCPQLLGPHDPQTGEPELQQWFGSIRQTVETVFSHLCESFGLKYPGAHTKWGLLTRVAAKLAAYNLGIRINRWLGRPDFAFAT